MQEAGAGAEGRKHKAEGRKHRRAAFDIWHGLGKKKEGERWVYTIGTE
jgi:hypothetical protein